MKKILLLLLLNLLLFAHDAPYRLKQFQEILKKTKLQAPTSHYDPRWSTKYGKFQYVSNRYFYLQDNSYMTFAVCGLKNRSELREREDWKVSTKKKRVLTAELYLFPLNSNKEFTFLQIHADPNFQTNADEEKSINKPLLRITWWKNLHRTKDHLWAVIRTSADAYEQKYVKIDLGKRKEKFTKFRISIQNSTLKVFQDGELKINMDVHYWDKQWNYFKAGVYMQDEGCAKVLFKKLEIQ